MSLRLRLSLALGLTAIPVVAGVVWVRRDLDERAYIEFVRGIVLERMYQNGREACEAYPENFPFPRRRWGRRGPGRPGGTRRPRGDDRGAPDGEGERPERNRLNEGGGGTEPIDERPPRPSDRADPREPGAPLENGAPRRPREPGEHRGHGRGGPGNWRERAFREGRGPPRVLFMAYGPDYLSRNPRAPEFPKAARKKLEAGADTVIDGVWVGLRMSWREGPCCVVLARRTGDTPITRSGDLIWTGAAICGALLLAVLLAAGPIVQRIRRLERDVRGAAAQGYGVAVPVTGGDEITRLARAFNDAGAEVKAHIDAVERREATLRRFLANTTHDVMTPLTVLQGHLSALPDDDRVAAARHEADYMSSLLHNLSAAAKLEAGGAQVRRDPVDLGELVGRVAARHKPVADKRGVALEYALPGDPVVVTGDVTLLEQAVGNVVHNAVRYNREGGRVAILLGTRSDDRDERGAAAAGAHSGDFWLRVIDDGPGVPEDELPRLGERRFRGEKARTRQPAGQGFGLSIAREVAARHGFELSFSRAAEGGLEVEFTGPANATDPESRK